MAVLPWRVGLDGKHVRGKREREKKKEKKIEKLESSIGNSIASRCKRWLGNNGNTYELTKAGNGSLVDNSESPPRNSFCPAAISPWNRQVERLD